jgi:exportin-5
MRADAQFSVVEAVIKGYNKWVSAHGKAPQRDVREWIGKMNNRLLTCDRRVNAWN